MDAIPEYPDGLSTTVIVQNVLVGSIEHRYHSENSFRHFGNVCLNCSSFFQLDELQAAAF